MAPGWAVFRNEQGKILKEENPDMAAADRLKELHAQWDALTDEQRAEYRETAVHNVERLRLLNARSLSLSHTHTHTHTHIYTMGTGISYGRGNFWTSLCLLPRVSDFTAARRSSTHISSGVIAKDEGAVVVRSKRLNLNAFISLTKIPTVVLVDITLKR
jgi:hypothetical protein